MNRILSVAIVATAFATEPAHTQNVSPASVWDGFYLGAVLGYGESSSYHCTDLCDADDLTGHPMTESTSAMYGVTVGYNVALDGFVLGVEGDYMGASFEDTIEANPSGGGIRLGTPEVFTNIDALATLRGRAGLDRGNFLPYVTGGMAFMSVEAGAVEDYPRYSGTETLAAPVAGLGAEWMLGSGWSVKTEFLHVFGSGQFFYDDPDGGEVCNRPGCSVTGVTMNVVRIGVNRHW